MGSSPQQQQEEEEMNLTEPLLRLHPRERNGSTTTAVGHSWLSKLLRSGTAGATAPNSAKLDCSAVTAYSRAGVLSRATFSWLNPLVKLGSIKTLQKEDVPQLAPQHRAARLHSLFYSHWREEGQETTVLHTLWSCFSGNILYTAFLALVKVGVTFVGPLLIQSFVDFCTESPSSPSSSSSSNTETTAATADSRSKSSTWTQAAAPYSSSAQGLILVAILVAGKGVEVLFTHQYNFTCQKLGMQIRSALITAVYAKGLRLSSESRQRHGVGQIVNYMSVDAQQMSDVMIHLHTLWAVPLQTAVAISILARVVGRSATLAGLLALSFTASMILAIARVQRKQQECIMQARDRRMRAFNESLTHMKVIKLQGWEEIFLKGVEDARRIEYMWLLKYVYSTAINILALWLTPLVTCVAIFSACIYFNDMTLAPGMAFTTVATVRTMEEPMRIFPQALIAVSQALVSLDRLDKYLWSRELEQDAVVKLPSDSDHPVAVKVECAFFKWDSKEEKATLSNINLAINRGSFVTVVGKVGAGKSSLIASLLGEMPKLNGTVELRGSVAYVPQSPWIQHGTIEENILFGLPMDRERYDDILQACALEMDIAQLDYGDQTEIGERGINLSGGQKQRIQLARAVYQNCDIYLLDDIFSALDAHTGSKIFQECVIEALIGKTVILVTHQIEFLHRANLILVMRDGTIVQSGTYEELSEAGLDFKDLVKAHSEALEKVNNNNNNNNSACDLWEDPYNPSYLDSPHLSTTSFSNLSSSCESISYLQHLEIPCSSPRCEEFNMETADLQLECNSLPFNGSLIHQFRGAFGRHPTTTTSATAQIIGCEERATGQVSRDIYWLYLTATYGGAIVILLILVQFVWQMFQIASDYWIAYETSESESPASKHPATAGKNFQAEGFIRVYAMLALGCAVCVLIRSLLVAFIGITTSQKFYDKMLHRVFRAPMSFFDTTPLGRVLSRASTDQAQMDTIIPILSGGLLAIAFATSGILVVMVGVTWQLILIIIPLSWIYYSYQVYYLTTSRELTRVDALTKAPVIQHFSETIAGSMTIRCFGHQERFAHVNLERVDQNLKMDFHNNAANEWIGFRLESIGTFVLSIAAFLLVSLPSNLIQTELVGLYLSYALFFNARLFNMVMLVCQLEKSMVSVERINQYTQLESEAPLVIQNSRPPKSWPSKGTIEFRDLKLRYRENTPLVLKGVTVTIKGGRKVGIVGRTGSGKSTLALALFRLVEPADGCILIDGIDIGTLGLSDLRANLSIIPQDPILFNGTIRSNLDPMGLYSDQQLWEALQKCQLASSVQQLKAKLETSVLENGENWSVGQRQLFCLGRALLKDTQILVLDEATASVDAETDALILKTVQEVFASRTVISIAHRIPTVMNSDKVLVLDAGKVKEYASPSKLLQDSTSVFASLVSEYSTRSSCSTSDLTAFDEFLPS